MKTTIAAIIVALLLGVGASGASSNNCTPGSPCPPPCTPGHHCRT